MHVFLYDGECFERNVRFYPGIVDEIQETPAHVSDARARMDVTTHIFLISRLGMCMQPTISMNSATMSLLLMVILATIFLSAVFFAEKFLSFLLPLFNSMRSSATLPCGVRRFCKRVLSKV